MVDLDEDKENKGIVVVDLCKPYGISMVDEAIEKKVVFFGYPVLNLENNSEIEDKLGDIFKQVKNLEQNCQNTEEFKKLKNLISELRGKDNFSKIIFNTLDEDDKEYDANFEKFKNGIKSIGSKYQDPFLHLLEVKNYMNNKNSNRSPFKNTRNIFKKIKSNKDVYVVVPHNPKVSIGKISQKNKFFYDRDNSDEDDEILAYLLCKFVHKLKKYKGGSYYSSYIEKDDKDIDNDYKKDLLANRKNILAQFLQAFKVEGLKTFSIKEVPLQYVMQRGTARIINNEKYKEAYNIIDRIYNNGKVEKDLSWLTPSYFEMLMLTLLKNEYGEGYEAYHTGGSGDYGIDGIIVKKDEKDDKLVAVLQCKSENITEGKAEGLVKEIREGISNSEGNKEDYDIYIATRGGYGKRNWCKGKQTDWGCQIDENVYIMDKTIIMKKLKEIFNPQLFQNFPDYELLEEIAQNNKEG